MTSELDALSTRRHRPIPMNTRTRFSAKHLHLSAIVTRKNGNTYRYPSLSLPLPRPEPETPKGNSGVRHLQISKEEMHWLAALSSLSRQSFRMHIPGLLHSGQTRPTSIQRYGKQC